MKSVKGCVGIVVFSQEQEVLIYSLKEMCPLSQPQKRLSFPAVVTCLFLVPAQKEVQKYAPFLPIKYLGSIPAVLKCALEIKLTYLDFTL